MRRLVACALVLVPSLAAAHRPPPPPRAPRLARVCPAAASYAALETCLKRLGDVTIARELPHARLLHVVSRDDNDLGLALYVENAPGWHVAGVYEPRGVGYEALSLAPVTISQHAGFRIDIGVAQHTWASLDSTRAVPVIVVARHALLCSGEQWRCAELVVACDVLVRGAALWTFRGSLAFGDHEALVTGDRSHGGGSCSVPERVFLAWPRP
ncbi:MAG: hypothetical protein ACM31C_22515 [Acidobacteriota bacterium]